MLFVRLYQAVHIGGFTVMPSYAFVAEGYLNYVTVDTDFLVIDVGSSGMGYFGEAAVS